MDPTFYRTAADAAAAPREELAYVVDLNPNSESYGKVVGWTDVPSSPSLVE